MYDYEGDMSYYQNKLKAQGITKKMVNMDDYAGLSSRELQSVVDSAIKSVNNIDCFAYDKKSKKFKCSALDVGNCRWKINGDKCPFFKTKKQLEAERQACER